MGEPKESQIKLRVGYFVKMFPRLSETFVLNEILELERQGVEVVIFSIKKSNEGRFHPQLSELKARVFYLDDLDPKKWSNWLRPQWDVLGDRKDNIWKLLDEELSRSDKSRTDYIWWGAWAAAEVLRLNLSHLHA
ncbi:MAG: hypothetical protein IIB00_07755, partial [candidate division Zixibacteria bacterium]|nr:hypothetical protein [candidate division Zixibacteria bacterium]